MEKRFVFVVNNVYATSKDGTESQVLLAMKEDGKHKVRLYDLDYITEYIFDDESIRNERLKRNTNYLMENYKVFPRQLKFSFIVESDDKSLLQALESEYTMNMPQEVSVRFHLLDGSIKYIIGKFRNPLIDEIDSLAKRGVISIKFEEQEKNLLLIFNKYSEKITEIKQKSLVK